MHDPTKQKQAEVFTWEHFERAVSLQAEDQGTGGDAEDLPGAEVQPVVDLEVEPSRHGSLVRRKHRTTTKE